MIRSEQVKREVDTTWRLIKVNPPLDPLLVEAIIDLGQYYGEEATKLPHDNNSVCLENISSLCKQARSNYWTEMLGGF